MATHANESDRNQNYTMTDASKVAADLIRREIWASEGKAFELPEELKLIAKQVQQLDLSRMPLTLDVLESLVDALPNLLEVNLFSTDVTVKELALLSRLKYLQYLSLGCCEHLDDAAVASLAPCQNLKYLTLEKTPITGTTLSKLPNSIEELILWDCLQLIDEGVAGLAAMHHLKILNLRGTPITGAFLSELPDSLQTLNLWNCSCLTDAGLAHLATKRHIKDLNVGDTLVKGTSFAYLPDSLEILNCEFCRELGDDALAGLASKKNLKTLILERTSITGKTLGLLPPSIEILDCSSCAKLTDESLKELVKMPNLKKLSLFFCRHISDETVDFLRKALPLTQIEH